MDFEIKWFDAKEKMYQVYKKHNGKMALAYSGGKDSSILLEMVRQLEKEKGTKILVVASDTGVELKTIRDRMYKNADVVLNLKNGYVKETFGMNAILRGKPFKNKNHDELIGRALKNKVLIADKRFTFERKYRAGKKIETIEKGMYYCINKNGVLHKTTTLAINGLSGAMFSIERYADHLYDNTLPPVSNKCCNTLKKNPFKLFTKENDIECWMTGERMNEGGSRARHMREKGCYYNSNGAMKLLPLKDFTNDDIENAIKSFKIDIDVAYRHFDRTGCWMCPYGKFRKDKFVFEDAYKNYDKENGTNYYKAFLAINKERIIIDKIKTSQNIQIALEI